MHILSCEQQYEINMKKNINVRIHLGQFAQSVKTKSVENHVKSYLNCDCSPVNS